MLEQNLAKHPLVIAAIGGILTLGGGWMRDRLSVETREASNAIRIESLETYRSDHSKVSVSREDLARVESALKESQRSYVTKEEFSQFSSAMLRASDELRTEMREIKNELRERRR